MKLGELLRTARWMGLWASTREKAFMPQLPSGPPEAPAPFPPARHHRRNDPALLLGYLPTPKTNRSLGMDILGKEVKDRITDFSGICTGRSTWLYGCDQYCVTPRMVYLPSGEPKLEDGRWFDEGRIEVIGEGIAPTEVQVERPGGDRPPPAR